MRFLVLAVFLAMPAQAQPHFPTYNLGVMGKTFGLRTEQPYYWEWKRVVEETPAVIGETHQGDVLSILRQMKRDYEGFKQLSSSPGGWKTPAEFKRDGGDYPVSP